VIRKGTSPIKAPAPRPGGSPTRKHTVAGNHRDKTAHRSEGEHQGERSSSQRPVPRSARGRVPFPRKNQPPGETEFLARLPLAAGRKLEAVRAFLKKQKGVAEDLYFYGPKTGWAFRYLRGPHSLATVMIHDDRLMGIVSLDAGALAQIDFSSLSDVAARARKMAHGSPSLLWLDIPLDGSGASDFKTVLKAKLKVMPPPAPLPKHQRQVPPTAVTRPVSARRPPPPPPRRTSKA
jgi:hypothetical protein